MTDDGIKNDLMNYDERAQEALRGVVRDVLKQVEASGFPGDHHLYIIFRTKHPDVQMSQRLRKRYPDDMTIVLQHQFWGLKVFDDWFEVDLSFNRQIEHLKVPFKSIKGFLDPSVEFGLQLNAGSDEPPLFTSTPDDDTHMERKPADVEQSPAPKKSASGGGGEEVSLDAFRNKGSGG